MVKNYLKGQKGSAGKLLYFIIWSRNPPAVFLDEVTAQMYKMPLIGMHFNADNQMVYQIIKSIMIDMQAYAWVQLSDAASNGRQAALVLMDQYDGPAEEENRYNMAKQEVKEAEYRGNEAMYPFSKYAATLQKAFTTMAQSNCKKLQLMSY